MKEELGNVFATEVDGEDLWPRQRFFLGGVADMMPYVSKDVLLLFLIINIFALVFLFEPDEANQPMRIL